MLDNEAVKDGLGDVNCWLSIGGGLGLDGAWMGLVKCSGRRRIWTERIWGLMRASGINPKNQKCKSKL